MALITCPKCKKKLGSSRTICPYCKTNLNQPKPEQQEEPKKENDLTNCPKCNGHLAKNARTCTHCGHRLTSATAKGCLWIIVFSVVVTIFSVNSTDTDKPLPKKATPPAKQRPKITLPETGEWKTIRSVDQLTSVATGALSLTSSSGRTVWGKYPSLIIRCKNNTPSVYINWHDFLDTEDTVVTTRIGQEPATTTIWSISSDKEATFYQGDATKLIFKLANTNKFVAQTTPYNESPTTAVFNTRFLREALTNIQDTCPFSVDTPD